MVTMLTTWTVYFDEDKAAHAANDPSESLHSNGGETNIPIVSSAIAMFGAVAAWAGISAGS